MILPPDVLIFTSAQSQVIAQPAEIRALLMVLQARTPFALQPKAAGSQTLTSSL